MIEFEADLANMSRLFVANEIAGAANVEVVTRKLEAGPQGVEIAEQLEPLFGGVGDRAMLGRRQIGIGARLRPPDPPAKLIELREAEAVGAVDD